MAEFEFKNDCAELAFGRRVFTLPVTIEEHKRLSDIAAELNRFAAEITEPEQITELVLIAVDGMLGEGASELILDGRECSAFDALDIYRFICSEYASAFRRRVGAITGRRAVR